MLMIDITRRHIDKGNRYYEKYVHTFYEELKKRLKQTIKSCIISERKELAQLYNEHVLYLSRLH